MRGMTPAAAHQQLQGLVQQCIWKKKAVSCALHTLSMGCCSSAKAQSALDELLDECWQRAWLAILA
jgi:hypothetical protein